MLGCHETRLVLLKKVIWTKLINFPRLRRRYQMVVTIRVEGGEMEIVGMRYNSRVFLRIF